MSRMHSFVGLMIVSGAVCAHHSATGTFDAGRTLEIEGIVREVRWRNPHSLIVLDVAGGTVAAQRWEIETTALSFLRYRGLDEGIVAVGDHIAIAGPPARGNAPKLLGQHILLADGRELNLAPGRPPFFRFFTQLRGRRRGS